MTLLIVSNVVLWLLVGLLTLVVIGLLRERGARSFDDPLARRTQGPPDGIVPKIEVRTLTGRIYTMGRGKRQLVLFVDRNCRPCHKSIAVLGEWLPSAPSDVDIVVVCRGDSGDCRDVVQEAKGEYVVVPDRNWNLGGKWQVHSTPACFLLNSDGVIQGQWNKATAEAFQRAFERANTSAAPDPVSKLVEVVQ